MSLGKQYRSNKMNNPLEKTERYLQSAGMSFFVYRVEEILLNINNLETKEEKSKLIKNILKTKKDILIKILEEQELELIPLSKLLKKIMLNMF